MSPMYMMKDNLTDIDNVVVAFVVIKIMRMLMMLMMMIMMMIKKA